MQMRNTLGELMREFKSNQLARGLIVSIDNGITKDAEWRSFQAQRPGFRYRILAIENIDLGTETFEDAVMLSKSLLYGCFFLDACI